MPCKVHRTDSIIVVKLVMSFGQIKHISVTGQTLLPTGWDHGMAHPINTSILTILIAVLKSHDHSLTDGANMQLLVLSNQ